MIELTLAEAQLWRNSPKRSRIVIGKSRSLLGSGHLFYYNVDSLSFLLREVGSRVNEMLTGSGNEAAKRLSRFAVGCLL